MRTSSSVSSSDPRRQMRPPLKPLQLHWTPVPDPEQESATAAPEWLTSRCLEIVYAALTGFDSLAPDGLPFTPLPRGIAMSNCCPLAELRLFPVDAQFLLFEPGFAAS